MDVASGNRKRREPYKKYLLYTEENTENLELLGKYQNHVKAEDLRKITERARKENNPGYYLVRKLMLFLFSTEEMASSRCQGLIIPKPGDIRHPLDANKIRTIKEDYCEKHQLKMATYTEMNSAITEAVGYSRKKLKKMNEENFDSKE